MTLYLRMRQGIFTISLDTELHWGVSDCKTVESYFNNLHNTRHAIDSMLVCFQAYDIHVTWAVVGFLFAENKPQLLSWIEGVQPLPTYINPSLNNYNLIPTLGFNEEDDPFHFGSDIIKRILQFPHQEIATHTFSHYYCLENGQTPAQFETDLQLAKNAAIPFQVSLRSIVFPRNQYSDVYLALCYKKGIRAYRGNEQHWLYAPRNGNEESLLRRGLRLIDSYLPLSGHHIHTVTPARKEQPTNIPASRFLRPYNKNLAALDPLKWNRIKKEMTLAAKEKKIYHLWWHPHNFGNHVEKNMALLELILKHYKHLQHTYGMTSLSMGEIAEQVVT